MCFTAHAADYDGTDIRRPYLVDNSTGTPVYTYLDDEDYSRPSNRSKRGATAYAHRLWPEGVVNCSISDELTGILVCSKKLGWCDKKCMIIY